MRGGEPIQDGTDARLDVFITLATLGFPRPGTLWVIVGLRQEGVVSSPPVSAEFALMQVGLELQRLAQYAGDDARGLARALVGTRPHQARLDRSRDALAAVCRLPVSQFGQRQIVR